MADSQSPNLYQTIMRQRDKLLLALFTIAVAWLAMLLAFQQPYSYTLDVSKAKPGETTGFRPIKGLGQPGYLWGDQYASFNLASPGSPLQITIRLGGRSGGITIPFTLNQQPFGDVTLPADGSMISHTFSVPFSSISHDSIHLGIVAPVLKANNQRLSVQVDTVTVTSSPALGFAWPPLGVLLVTTIVALLLATLAWQLRSLWRWLVPVGGVVALYPLMVGRANIVVPLMLFGASLLLILIAVSGAWRIALGWLITLRAGSVPISLKRLPDLVRADGPETMPIFRLVLILVVLLQIPLEIGTPNSLETPVSLYYFVGLLLMLVAFVLRGRAVTLALLLAVAVASLLLRLYWANLPTDGDVFWANQQAAYFVLNGQNPYAEIFTWVPHQVYPWYGYFPFTIFSQLPFYLLGNNVRLGLVCYDLATVALIYLLARRYLNADIAAAIATLWLLYIPFSNFTIEQSIVDPVMMFWMVLSFYLLTREQWLWAAVAGGLALGSKQYAILYVLVLFMFLLQQKRWRAAAVLLAVPTAIILPYFLWSPADFIGDTVILHLSWAPLPAPFGTQWNVSLWAQWLGMTNGIPADAVHLKPYASAVLLAVLALVAAVNLFKLNLTKVVGTTTVLMATTFALNSGYTQFFYWRDVVIMVLLWAAVWQADVSEVLANPTSVSSYLHPPPPSPDAEPEREPVMAGAASDQELR